MERIETSPQTPEMARARVMLKTLAQQPGPQGVSAAMAFCGLGLTVSPPYPPVGDVSDMPPPTPAQVRHALGLAARTATTVAEAAAIAQAGDDLKPLLP